MTSTTGATGDIEYKQVIVNVNDPNEFIVLKAEISRLKEHIEIMGETLNNDNLEMLRLEAENAALRAALEAVEWEDDGWHGIYCPWCCKGYSWYDDKPYNHAPDCQRQAALGLTPKPGE